MVFVMTFLLALLFVHFYCLFVVLRACYLEIQEAILQGDGI